MEQDEFAMSAFINELLVLVGLIKVGVWGGCSQFDVHNTDVCVMGEGLVGMATCHPTPVLWQSEDKKFIPVEEKEGPLMMLGRIAKQPYFGRMQRNTVIAFLSK